ncbi:MAG: hypothetical protein IT436_00405 [Phycisphaerales bacterium]|nr:hypothetical protein [Phycisphaerales bacterium]
MNHAITAVFLLAATSAASAQLCAPWEVVPTPSPADATQAVIRDLDAIAPDDVWAVGSYYNGERIAQMSMHWNGSGWRFFDIPVYLSFGSGFLWAVEAAGPNDVWAAGDQIRQAPDGFVGTHTLVVRWDGSGWHLLPTPIQSGGSGDLIWDIEIVGPDNVWFVGEGHPVPVSSQPSLAMRWDGSSFEIIPTPIINPIVYGFGNGNSLHALDALGPDDMWAVGAGGDGDPIIGASQILHWNGSDWEHRPGPIPGRWHQLDAVIALSSTDVWAGGEYFGFDGAYHGFAIHWNGSSWTEFPVPTSITDFVAYAPDDIYASGGGVMHWDGESWTIVETFPTVLGPSLTSIDSTGPCQLWTAGRQLIGDSVFNFAARVAPAPACPADLNGDGLVDFADYLVFLNLYESADPRADFTADGTIDFADYLEFLNRYDAGC